MKQMTKQAVLALVGVLVVLAFAPGCDKKSPTIESNRLRVKGIVLLDGKPIQGGSITIVSAKDEKYGVTSVIKTDGTFSITDAPLGDVMIAIDTQLQKFNNPTTYVPIPAKYADVRTSGLTAVIKKDAGAEGPQKLTIELKSK